MKRLDKKGIIIVVCIIVLLSIISFVMVYYNFFVGPQISNIEVKDSIRFEGQKVVNVEVSNHFLKLDKSTWCLLTKKNESVNIDDNNWVKASNGYCSIITSEDNYDVYVKDKFGNIFSSIDGIKKKEKKKVINNQTAIKTDVNNVYLYIGLTQLINVDRSNIKSNSKIIYESKDTNIATVDQNGLVTGINYGKTLIIIRTDDNKYYTEIGVVVTRLIKRMDPTAKRDYFTCQMLSEEENELLDKILFDRVERAGYKTRAGVLAAARFLTLESTYEVPYFYENGRLENYEPYKYVDGEGRYYHRGLYLSAKKIKDLKATFVGPAMWGCELQNYTDWNGEYVTGQYYPNGLDCSGFVTWALLNGGFDVGDIGAGVDPDHKDVTDLGERIPLSEELMASGRVKAGDLIGLDGHAAILVGWDENNYYIAESLNTTKGVVVTTVKRSDLVYNSIYKYVVLMDRVYKDQGNYSTYWK